MLEELYIPSASQSNLERVLGLVDPILSTVANSGKEKGSALSHKFSFFLVSGP